MEESDARHPSPRPGLALLGLLLAFITFAGLGTWQIQRLGWKQDLIARVEARIRAAPEPAPTRVEWASVTAAAHEYRRVRAEGAFLHDRETLVQAVTDRGGGYWVMTPLRRADGTLVLINRGFVPPERRDPATRDPIPERVAVTGLLRMSEPGGGFLRRNDPAGGRWYSRDVAAIAASKGLGETAPYFIDADASPDQSGAPVGGLTVVSFPNNHLVYAATWYALALMVVGAALLILRDARRVG